MRKIFGLLLALLTLAAGAVHAQNNAAFVSQSVPASMVPGQTYAVSVTMQNTGTSTWTTATNYKLGSQNPDNNTTWGFSRVELPGGGPVAPGQSVTFNFNVTASSAPQIRNFQWRMAQEGVHFFGQASPNIPVDVGVGSAAFVSQSVPASMTPGQSYPVSITLQNTGLTTWTSANLYRLGSQSPDNNTTWGFSRVELPNGDPVPPGGSATFSFNVTPPATNGTYNFHWRMARDGVAFFGAQTPNVAVKVGLDHATFVSQSVPDVMLPGQTYPVSVTMRNTGGAVWTSGGAAPFRLGSWGGPNNTTWGLSRVELPNGTPVLANETVTFNFNVTAPSAVGAHNFQWKMAHETVAYFGQESPSVLINIGRHGTITSQSVPTTMDPGQTYPVSVTARNTGSTTWTVPNFKLGSLPQNTMLWGVSRALLPNGTPVPSGATVTFNFNVTAPATAGTHNFQWSMLEETVSYFAASGPIAQVKVGLDKAEFVSQSVPSEMNPGQSYPVSVTMKNIGTTTWQPGTVSLGSQNPADNTTWGLTRAPLAAAVAPGANGTFSFNVTAPSAPGVHNFQWRLVDGASSWFGTLSPNLAVSVSADNAAFVSQTVPSQMSPGQTYSAMVTLQNTGISTWTTAQGYRLGSTNPAGNTTWGSSTVDLPFDVPPGATVIVPFNAIAPASAGTYNFQWRMLHGASAFGASTPNVAVNVATSGATLPGMNFIHVDHLNTPRLIANASGQAIWRWDQQEPFGVNPPDENPSGLGVYEYNPRLAGQYFDKETNLHYNYFRDCYDSTLGRYCQSDPIGLEGGPNSYAYVDNNPLEWSDPAGLQPTQSRTGGGSRTITFPATGQGTYGGQQGVWSYGQFYPRLNQTVTLGRPQLSSPVPPPPSPYARYGQGASPNQTLAPLTYCPIPYIGYPPVSGTASRTNTTGTGNPFDLFAQYAIPGTATYVPMLGGGYMLQSTSILGGTTNVRLMPNGSIRVDVSPGGGAVPTTVHFTGPK